MKFLTTKKMAASVALAISAGNAQALLTSTNTLSIQADATTAMTASGSAYTISGDGPLVDSFFAIGGSKTKDTLGTQYVFMFGGTNMTLTGATQSNIATWTFYGQPGNIGTVGTGISILSASGDVASLDLSGLKWNWDGSPAAMGTGAWSSGYSNGIGNLTCATGSGCAVGSAYTLKYTATVPPGDPSSLGSIQYYFELHGTVGTVPEASTYGMMLAGLTMIGVSMRHRRICQAR